MKNLKIYSIEEAKEVCEKNNQNGYFLVGAEKEFEVFAKLEEVEENYYQIVYYHTTSPYLIKDCPGDIEIDNHFLNWLFSNDCICLSDFYFDEIRNKKNSQIVRITICEDAFSQTDFYFSDDEKKAESQAKKWACEVISKSYDISVKKAEKLIEMAYNEDKTINEAYDAE